MHNVGICRGSNPDRTRDVASHIRIHYRAMSTHNDTCAQQKERFLFICRNPYQTSDNWSIVLGYLKCGLNKGNPRIQHKTSIIQTQKFLSEIEKQAVIIANKLNLATAAISIAI